MRIASILLLLGARLGYATQDGSCADRPLADTRQGPVQGIRLQRSVDAFLGIPYARPPIGSLRFEPPVPPQIHSSHRNPYNATSLGPSCYQFHYKTVLGHHVYETTEQSEDCLTLNVYVPRQKHRHGKKLPVFVWSYGGAFGEGGSSVSAYDPTSFVANQKDIIVVTWNYRMNLFGFPNSPALEAQNLGLRDQRAALEWLRDNISGFGGDPERIVLGGQSSGADTGSAMVYSHAEDPIASALALQSGTVQVIGAIPENADSEFVRVASVVGCADARNRSKELQCMRRVDADILHHAVSNKTANSFGSPPGGSPMVDNVTIFMPDEYVRRGKAGKFARLPTLMGNMDNEGDSVLNWDEKCGINKTLSKMATTVIFDCNIALEAGFRDEHKVPIWRYRYMGVFPGVTPYPWLGAYHVADVPMLFGNFRLFGKKSESENAVAQTARASRYYQNMFGTFIRDPSHGLGRTYGFERYRRGTKTTIALFPENHIGSALINSAQFDNSPLCRADTPFPWIEVAKGPPRC